MTEKKYIFKLYITGINENSSNAIRNFEKICEEYLNGEFQLEVIDLYQNPAIENNILATPTLVKELPLPIKKLIGDLSNTKEVLISLDIEEKKS